MEGDVARFTVITHLDALAAGAAIRQISGELADNGSATVHSVVDGRPVDIEVDMVAVRTAAPSTPGPRRDLVTLLALGVVLAVVVAWLGRADSEGQPDTGAPPDPRPPASSVAVDGAVDATDPAARFVPWPDLPEDHDPHVSGRPGSGDPLRPELAGRSLVYVNDRGRPTVLDLSTGDQRELDIAPTRSSDSFMVEDGQVVAAVGRSTVLPEATGRALVFAVVVDGAAMAVFDVPSPVLCVSDDADCPARPWTTGRFGDDERWAESLPGSAPAVLGSAIGARDWSSEGRWTTFRLTEGAEVDEFRVPTPREGAVVWSVVEPG